jgi:phosphoserine phosphatase RsbU/P
MPQLAERADELHEPWERPCVLVADDQSDVLEALRLLLKGEGFEVRTVSSPAAVLAALQERRLPPYDALLMDLNYARDTTSGLEGLELVGHVRALDPDLPIVVMTAWSTVPLAVSVMREGALDFVEKPWQNERLMDALRRHVTAGRSNRRARRLERDAREVQRRLLARALPAVPGYDLGVAWLFADGLGGDGYHAAPLSGGRLAVTIADVCGKGTPAALLLAGLQVLLEEAVAAELTPRQLCARLAKDLAPRLAPDRFVSLVHAVLDPGRGTLSYVNAGHPAPLLLRADGGVRRLERGGPVLGVLSDADYEEGALSLEPGDRLVLVTDGVTEAASASAELGEAGLVAALQEQTGRSAADCALGLLEAARAFSGDRLHDDATIVVAEVAGR